MGSAGSTSAARLRENEETFAKANEQIRTSAEQYDFNGAVPFLCECSEVGCTENVRLSLTDYREARGRGAAAFILVPGHDDPHVERIIAQGDGYVLVEKFF